MIILVGFLLCLWGISDLCASADDIMREQREIKRHKELVELQKQKPKTRKITRRRIVKQGDVTLGEEITEEE